MLLKRALFLVSAENEVEPLVEFAKVFKKRYNVKVDAIYVKDILKYDVFPITVEGIGINLGTNFAYKEFRNIENKTFEKIKAPLEKEFSKVYTKEGESAEVALEELKKYIPETSDFDVGVVEQFYKVAEEKHSSEKEKLLKIYLFGYLLTSLDDFDFTKVQVSNIVIEETGGNNQYLMMYKQLLKTLGIDENETTVSIV